ncbi:hypothetical protein ACHAXR_012249 [Thalassiosira sp. AJA248-18]
MALQQNKQYAYQARLTLQNSFQRISCAAIDAIIRSSDFKFTDAFNSLTNVMSKHGTIDGDGAGHFDGFPQSIKIFIKQKRPEKTFQLTNPRLLDEIADIPELNTKQNNRFVDEKVAEEKVDDAKDPELELECLCCYADYLLSEMMECSAGSGHFVCKTCINHFVSEQLDGNDSVTFKCIADAECVHKYPNETLDQDGVLSPRLKDRMNDRVFREMVKEAGLGNEWTCPKCAYIGFVDQAYPWINCPECNCNYCTSCNDVVHDNKTCEDARKEKVLLKDSKHQTHEAMSQACKRFCPHCNQEYMKSDGCNKIRCKCGKLSCYLCEEKVTDYTHFCQHELLPGTNHCTCGNACRLWTSTEAMEMIDRDRRQVAGRKVLTEAGINNEKDIISILDSPPKKESSAGKEAVPPPQPNVARGDPRPNLGPPNDEAAPVRINGHDFGELGHNFFGGINWRVAARNGEIQEGMAFGRRERELDRQQRENDRANGHDVGQHGVVNGDVRINGPVVNQPPAPNGGILEGLDRARRERVRARQQREHDRQHRERDRQRRERNRQRRERDRQQREYARQQREYDHARREQDQFERLRQESERLRQEVERLLLPRREQEHAPRILREDPREELLRQEAAPRLFLPPNAVDNNGFVPVVNQPGQNGMVANGRVEHVRQEHPAFQEAQEALDLLLNQNRRDTDRALEEMNRAFRGNNWF